jgi:hypothetical protein
VVGERIRTWARPDDDATMPQGTRRVGQDVGAAAISASAISPPIRA